MRNKLAQFAALCLERRAKRIVQGHDMWRYVGPYLEKSVSTGCDYVDYLALYNHVRKHKPQYVLELGTGVSTVVLAYALRENRHGMVVSMEDNEYYLGATKKIFPEELKDVVEFHLSPAVEKTRDFFRGSGYKDIPAKDYEFVFVDGPNLLVDTERPPDAEFAFNFDFIEAVRMSRKPVAGLIDTRTTTCFAYHLLLGEKFRYNYLQRQGVMLPCTPEDLLNAKQITARAMRRRAFRRTFKT